MEPEIRLLVRFSEHTSVNSLTIRDRRPNKIAAIPVRLFGQPNTPNLIATSPAIHRPFTFFFDAHTTTYQSASICRVSYRLTLALKDVMSEPNTPLEVGPFLTHREFSSVTRLLSRSQHSEKKPLTIMRVARTENPGCVKNPARHDPTPPTPTSHHPSPPLTPATKPFTINI